MRILGIDLGSRYIGYGILEGSGHEPMSISSGVIDAGRGSLPRRLAYLFVELKTVFLRYAPNEVAIEEVFTGINVRSALVLCHARGVIMLAAGLEKVPVHAYAARQIKQVITGYGAAEKVQVQAVLRGMLGELPMELDASDALAVACCHWYGRSFAKKVNRTK